LITSAKLLCSQTKLGDNRISGGFWRNMWNIRTLWLYSLNRLGGQTPQPIFTQNGLNDVDSRTDDTFAVKIVTFSTPWPQTLRIYAYKLFLIVIVAPRCTVNRQRGGDSKCVFVSDPYLWVTWHGHVRGDLLAFNMIWNYFYGNNELINFIVAPFKL